MTRGSSRERGRVARRITLEQRRALERIQTEVAGVVKDIEAMAARLGVVGELSREASPTERATMHLLCEELRRLQLELARLYGECDSLAFRRSGRRPRTDGVATP